jgi:hypothetical protein
MLQIERTIRALLTSLKDAETKAEGIEIIKTAKLNVKIKALKAIDENVADELDKLYKELVIANSKKD